MKWETHAATAVAFGLGVDAAFGVVGYPLPAIIALELPWVAAYASTFADVDHHSAKIRYACPPARFVYTCVYRVVAMVKGEGYARRTMGHRKITHSYVTAAIAAAVVEAALAAFIITQRIEWPLARLLWAVGPGVYLGWAGHIWGDGQTVHGCPKYAPFSWRCRGPRWARTGHGSERVFNAAQTLVGVALLVSIIGGGLWRV